MWKQTWRIYSWKCWAIFRRSTLTLLRPSSLSTWKESLIARENQVSRQWKSGYLLKQGHQHLESLTYQAFLSFLSRSSTLVMLPSKAILVRARRLSLDYQAHMLLSTLKTADLSIHDWWKLSQTFLKTMANKWHCNLTTLNFYSFATLSNPWQILCQLWSSAASRSLPNMSKQPRSSEDSFSSQRFDIEITIQQ